MPNELILKADAVRVLEDFAHQINCDGCKPISAHLVFQCAHKMKDLPAWGEELHARWVNRNGYTTCSNCGMLGYTPWKRCPVCEAKMDLEDA